MIDPATFNLLRQFRAGVYQRFDKRADALFELLDAVTVAGLVPSLAYLSLPPVHRRRWGSLYDALAAGDIDAPALRELVARYPLDDGQPIYALDTSVWPRDDAETSPGRAYYHSSSRQSAGQPITTGWSYAWLAQLNFTHDSWTAPLDVQRVQRVQAGGNAHAVAAAQIGELVERLPANCPIFSTALTGGMPSCFPISRAIKGAVDQLAREVPSLAAPASVLAMAGLVGADFPGFRRPASLAPGAEQVRVYDAFADVCLHLAKQRPLLLALDDLQWADTGTWQMVAYAARAANATPLGIVLACRDEVLAPGSTGAQAVVELNRHRLLVHLPLARLTQEALRLLGQELLGGPVTDELAAALVRRSEGNPFFAEEVLRGLKGQLVRDWSGAYYLPAKERPTPEVPTPATLRLTIVRRLEGLPAETRAVVNAASVLGRSGSFSSRLLARMRGQDIDEVERCLRPAVDASVITGSAGEYVFNHDIIRETAYDLAAGERRRLHEAAARALEEDGVRSVERLATLAHHWREADVPPVAARAASAAARAASTAAAHTEALDYGQQRTSCTSEPSARGLRPTTCSRRA